MHTAASVAAGRGFAAARLHEEGTEVAFSPDDSQYEGMDVVGFFDADLYVNRRHAHDAQLFLLAD